MAGWNRVDCKRLEGNSEVTSAEVKKFIGKLVEVTWEDPCEERQYLVDAHKGRKALAKWVEWGKIDDVTERVLRMRHGEGYSPTAHKPNEALYGWIDVGLITDIRRIDK